MKSFVAYHQDLEKTVLSKHSEPVMPAKLLVHFELYKKVRDIEGSIVKCGITAEEGFTRFAMFRSLTEAKQGQKVVAFEKITKELFVDNHTQKGNLSYSTKHTLIDFAQLQETLQKKGINGKIDFIPGNLGDAIPDYLIENPELKVAYLHIDLDDYEASLTALEFFYPRLVHKGVLVLDNYYKQEEDYKAVTDYFEKADIMLSNYSLTKGPHYLIRE